METFNIKIRERIKSAIDSIPGIIIFSILFIGLSLVVSLAVNLANSNPVA